MQNGYREADVSAADDGRGGERRFNLTLRELEVLRALVEAGTATTAARRLGLTQPAISRALAQLEEALGRTLFDRSGGRLVPTTDCLIINEELGPVFAALERISRPEAPRQKGRGHTGRMVVAAPPTIAHRFLPSRVARFIKMNPDLEVTFEVVASDALITGVAEGRYEVALTDTVPSHPAVRTEVVLASEAVCALPSRHRLAAKEVIEPADLTGEPFVALTRRHSGRIAIDRVLERAGVTPSIVVETATAVSAAEFVAEGLGVALLNPFPIAHRLAPGVVIRPFTPAVPYRTSFLTPSSQPISPAAADFIQMVRAELVDRFSPGALTQRR